MKLVPDDPNAFLRFDEVVALNDAIKAMTAALTAGAANDNARAQAVFEWVRDHVPHSKDIGAEVVTCTAIEAFGQRTGICFAKAHLLAAMLRHLGIPTGFCYQVFANPLNPSSGTRTLHGLNAIFLQETGRWHRIDPRGNRADVHAEFSLEQESLAFPDMAFLDDCIYAVPLANVVSGLKAARSITSLWPELPAVPANR